MENLYQTRQSTSNNAIKIQSSTSRRNKTKTKVNVSSTMNYYYTFASTNHKKSSEKDDKPVQKRNFFTEEEDHLLTMAVIKYKKERWSTIAKYVPGRTPKQCRDRWVNYLQPSLTFDPWTKKEDELLLSLVNTYGTHWSKMMSSFPNRSTNSVKNRWYWLLKNEVKLPIETLNKNRNLDQKVKNNEICENTIQIRNNFQSNRFQLDDTDLITFTPEELEW